MKALFIGGVPDNGKADVVTTEQGSLSVVVSGSSNLSRFLTSLPGDRAQFYMAGQGGEQRYSLDFFPDIIINEISDADSHRVALQRCIAFCQQQGKPVINPPEAILATTREAIAEKLQGIEGLQLPMTVRIAPRTPQALIAAIAQFGLVYPVIFRAAGDHGGISTVRINGEADVEAACYGYALDGRDYYLTQLINYQSPDGYYRKYRLAVVGSQVFLRHLVISDQWLVHAGSRNASTVAMAEEQAVLESFQTLLAPKLQPMIATISEVLGLDYFGIDCALSLKPAGPSLLAFEINANMNMLINPQPIPNIWQQPVAAISEALTGLIKNKAGL